MSKRVKFKITETLPKIRTLYTDPGTYEHTFDHDGVYLVKVQGAGGGSGGARSTTSGSTAQSGGGGAGGYCEKYFSFEKGQTMQIIVGQGGSPGTATPSDGGNGGSSSFGDLLATGGFGSKMASATTTYVGSGPGKGGQGSGGEINSIGDSGQMSPLSIISNQSGGIPGCGGSSRYCASEYTDNGTSPDAIIGAGAGGSDTGSHVIGLPGARGGHGVIEIIFVMQKA